MPIDHTYHDNTNFAPDLPREHDTHWIQVPDDVGWRKSVFPESVWIHKARMHMYIQEAIINYVSKPGEICLDPMSGTGTVMIAAIMGRPTICIEIESKYQGIEEEARAKILADNPNAAPIILLKGNCKLVLPVSCHHVMFSPPYANVFKPAKNMSKITKEKYRFENEDDYHEYANTQGNVGIMNPFLHNQEMEKVYQLCYDSIMPGGTLSTVTKDYIKGGKRQYLTDWIIKVCTRMGFEFDSINKVRMMGGPWQDIRRSKGEITVDDEDITIFRKPL